MTGSSDKVSETLRDCFTTLTPTCPFFILQTVRVWDIGSGQCVSVFTDHTHVVQSVCFAPNMAAVAIDAVSPSRTTSDVRESNLISGFPLILNHPPPTPQNPPEFVASGSRDNTIRVFDVRANRQFCVLVSPSPSF